MHIFSNLYHPSEVHSIFIAFLFVNKKCPSSSLIQHVILGQNLVWIHDIFAYLYASKTISDQRKLLKHLEKHRIVEKGHHTNKLYLTILIFAAFFIIVLERMFLHTNRMVFLVQNKDEASSDLHAEYQISLDAASLLPLRSAFHVHLPGIALASPCRWMLHTT
ncbi:hypothetical protein ACJX0J_015546 [Zea mays]